MLAVVEPQHTLHDVEVAGEHVVVGRYYFVPCVRGIPVVGDPHLDNDHFNTTELHYHCDSRFHDRSGDAADCAVFARGRFPTVERGVLQDYDPDRRETPTMEVKLCLRDTPAPWADRKFTLATMSLYADYGFAKSACGRCPHKGMPIINGVCSGHRLKWDADGSIAHKPPYTFRIRGTSNVKVITERCELDLVEIEIVEQVKGNKPVLVDMEDRDGIVLATHHFNIIPMEPGDTFKITFGGERKHYD